MNVVKSVIIHLSIFGFFLITFNLFSQTEYEPPKLTCVRNITTAPSGTELNWNLPLTPNPCFTGYEIYASTGSQSGPYSLVATVVNPLQTSIQINPPTIPLFNPSNISYFYMVNRGSCNNPSPPASPTSDTLSNERPQPKVKVKTATVSNSDVILTWAPGSPEVAAYIIYSSLDGFNKGDTIFGRFNTSYTDTRNNPKFSAVKYTIRAMELCEDPTGSALNGSVDSFQTTKMKLTVDQCTQTANIQWDNYSFGSAQPTAYEIQTNVNNAGYTTVANAAGGVSFYLLPNLQYNIPICIRIITHLSTGLITTSNDSCFIPKVNTPPLNDYIRNVSVENGNIMIEYKKDTLATPPPPDKQPILYRSDDGIVFYYVDKAPVYTDAYTILWNDDNVPAASRPYFYYVRINDSCTQNPPHFSDTATTLYLSVKLKSSNKADIIWSGFNIDNITFNHFKLEKITGTDTTLLGTFPRSQTTTPDNKVFDPLVDTLANICYRITAEFTNNNDPAPRATLESHSYIVCVQPEPEAFVPQAFVPAGLNKTFRPFLLYAKPDNYSFQIYDRWHRLVYSTNNVNDSWDGIYNGSPAPLDGYIYVVTFTGKNGQEYTQAGTVLLIR